MISFKLKKVGNHWYPSLEHNEGCLVGFNEKIDRVLDLIDFRNNQIEELNIDCEEAGLIWDDIRDMIEFKENDICRYLTTDDNFDLTFIINNHEFQMSSDLYFWLEQVFNFNFHKENYIIHIY